MFLVAAREGLITISGLTMNEFSYADRQWSPAPPEPCDPEAAGRVINSTATLLVRLFGELRCDKCRT